ncbi:hypothetical protein Intca_0445 [Intrasporangium calvum DSM 43043]|uniref:Uncharacterized protein n=1 Tax=Intrasporangium calvum (strain ATCC 23552 / DSM 43043 / JCM 3097 / NBRC 12989 / NCIMB 10167 / NRRL B-3866 / 7 KIP) TaxID=710696 RepID=E6S8M4_INTC7|nr:hypothetical protein Intca_0445 [Intrasporangium calvum DSM 43043]
MLMTEGLALGAGWLVFLGLVGFLAHMLLGRRR